MGRLGVAAAVLGALALGVGGGAVSHLVLTPGGSSATVATVAEPAAHTSAVPPAAGKTVGTAPPVNACAGNRRAQFVLVSISRQHAWMCQGSRAVFDTAVTTGAISLRDRATPTGTFAIQDKQRDQVLLPSTGDRYPVKYWIPFDAPAYGFHDASWQNFSYGSQLYRSQGSHGCVHMPLASMSFLYRWAKVGTAVRIQA